MAAPTTQTRVTPAGIPLQDGYQTKIVFGEDPNISFWETSINPPAIEGGDPIDTTTMYNIDWFTKAAQSLKDLQPFTLTAGWDPDLYDEADNLINVEGEITVLFPDGSTLDFFGYMQRFEPQELVRGTFPLCTITVVPTNYDPTNHVEAGPVLTEVAGT